MSETTDFLKELARQVKRHPQSYPAWMSMLAEDIIEATDNIARRNTAVDPTNYMDQGSVERMFALRALGGISNP